MTSSPLPRRALPLLLIAQAPDPLAQVMAALAAVRESRATFVEEREVPELDRPLRSAGILLWRAPDRLEKHTLEPVEERFVVEGDRLTLDRPARNIHEAIALDSAPELRPLVEAIRAIHAGDVATLRAYHEVSFSGSLAQWRLVLVPRSPRALAAVQRITLEGQRGSVRLLETQGRDGLSRMVVTPAA